MWVRMMLRRRGNESVHGNGFDKLAMLHAFESDELVGKFFYLSSLTVNDEHLKTGVVVKVSMRG